MDREELSDSNLSIGGQKWTDKGFDQLHTVTDDERCVMLSYWPLTPTVNHTGSPERVE